MPRLKRARNQIETIHVPEDLCEHAMRRIDGFAERATYSQNFLQTLMLSCYQQGLMDGIEVAEKHPELLAVAPSPAKETP